MHPPYHKKGSMALATNSAIINAGELRSDLEMNGLIFHSVSDSEIMASIFIKERLRTDSIEAAIAEAMKTLEGAYSVVAMSPRKLIGVRDPRGFRPLGPPARRMPVRARPAVSGRRRRRPGAGRRIGIGRAAPGSK